MRNIDWDNLQRQVDELNSDCPWLDDENESSLEKETLKADMEEE